LLKSPKNKNIYRVIDANTNRAKEGLRVCEEVARFILNNRPLTARFKEIRHRIDSILRGLPGREKLIEERESLSDVGKNIYAHELRRTDCRDILFANLQRVKESLRVLEEFGKLMDSGIARRFKRVRYDIYEIEKETTKRISSLFNS